MTYYTDDDKISLSITKDDRVKSKSKTTVAKAVNKEALTQEEQLEFRSRWYEESNTIGKVIKLETRLRRPLDLFDIYLSGSFDCTEVDFLNENGILHWLSDGLIPSRCKKCLQVDGSNSALCSIIQLTQQGNKID